MTDLEPKLDFSLPQRPSTAGGGGGKPALLLIALAVLLSAANLAALLIRGNGGRSGDLSSTPASPSAGAGGGLSVEAKRELALKLEGQGLNSVAAEAWIDYLATREIVPGDASAIWYRIGKLQQEAGKFEEALAAYYRCESLDPDTALKGEIGRRAQESLEAMGKFAALRQELANRVSMDGTGGAKGEEVIAEIGQRKITRAELDQRIEARIENQLSRFAAMMPDDQRRQQKEVMLKSFSTDSQRMQFLQSFIAEEVLYRKARESKLLERPEVRAQLQDIERELLSEQMMAKEVTEKIVITESDLETYFEANKSAYVEPESVMISQIIVANEEDARAISEKLRDADSGAFAAMAKERSEDEGSRESGGEVTTALVKGRPAPAGVAAAVMQRVTVGEDAESGAMLPDPIEINSGHALVFVRSREPERQMAFADVRERVHQELRTRKQQEFQQQLIDRLRDEYDVVIHQSKIQQSEEGK